MEPIRVIGRIDLAEPIQGALLAAGADARLATAAPLHLVATTGKDGTGVDVIANGLDVCRMIKRASPARPVVVVTVAEQEHDPAAMASEASRTAWGPDAHLPWPASGAELLAACARAQAAAAGPRRPRATPRMVLGVLVLVGAMAVLLWAFGAEITAKEAGPEGRAGPWPSAAMSAVECGMFLALAEWTRRRPAHLPRRPWRSALLVFWYFLAGLQALSAIVNAAIALGG